MTFETAEKQVKVEIIRPMKYNEIDISCSLAKGGIIDNWYAAGTIKKFGLREIDYV
mgnify:CR=1 FL=1